jgi:hypothetical protein
VHQDVDAAAPLRLCFVDHPVDVVRLGDIGSNGNRLAACSARGHHHLLRFGGARPVVDDNPKPLPRKELSSCRTDSAARASDYRNA